MEHPILFFSLILNAMGLPAHGGASFLDQILAPHMQYDYLAIVVVLLLAFLGTSKLKIVPSGLQNIMEMFVGGLLGFVEEQVGSRERAMLIFPMIATFGFVILISDFFGLIPGFMSPTANINVTLANTIIAIVAYHAIGIKYHGLKYIKHFMGPIPVMAPFFLVVEAFSHMGRIASLSIRLFGNMMSKEMLLGLLVSMAGPFFAPLPIMLLGTLVCILQAFIFVVLPVTYCSEAFAEAH
ncbi:MAG TPA: ATP synthase F0 subunit A [Desulfobulbaceae bacterium]|nr:ATP synthase F0 subunit A [Desulfobulbaceae bacterium]HHH52613.1 ATP synthase F0 subunit A [Bacteroidota bacterium]